MKMNKINFQKLIGTGLCFAILTGSVACSSENADTTDTEVVATETETESTWDNSRFNTRFASDNRFTEWDQDQDNMLNEDEFTRSMYSTWDTNKDNNIDQNEWDTATRDYGVTGRNFSDMDKNSDNNLDETEFRTGMANDTNNNFYKNWDRNQDKNIDQQEYSEGVFGQWDAGGTGTMRDTDVNDRYDRYYGGGTTGTTGTTTGTTGTTTGTTGTTGSTTGTTTGTTTGGAAQ